MGKIKDSEAKTYVLTDREFNYARFMMLSLTYNINKDRLVSGFLSYIAHNRLGYPEGMDLQFEIDLDGDSHELSVKATEPLQE